MARYPGAVWRPLPGSRPDMAAYNIFCVHTMVGSLAGSEAHFKNTGLNSHFGIGNPTDGANDGAVWQWVDTVDQSGANYQGNHDVISVETSDGGDPNRPWSPKALDALVALGVWVCRTYGIPPVLIPDNKPGRRGLAYHRQGCDHSSSYKPKGWPYDQWRVSGGVKWSKAQGKVCPGDVRIKQFVDHVIPRIAAEINGEPNPIEKDATMITTVPLPDSNGSEVRKSLAYECGSNSAVCKRGWFSLTAGWGDVDVNLFPMGPGGLVNMKAGPSATGKIPKNTRVTWELPDGCNGVNISYTAAEGVTLGAAFLGIPA